jgi:filamentous hemagglutinin family protein
MAAQPAQLDLHHQTCQLLFLALCLGLGVASRATGQIVPDGTLPTNSSVTTVGPLTTIAGGTTAGTNLFHSFQQFSLPSGTAFFDNDLAIRNILVRVTGGLPSDINGLLQANGSANLFLINPNGISFGADARLTSGGSFFASTAQSIQFADGLQFSAVAPQNSLLTISVPIGLQYGASPAPITVQGNGNNVAADFFTFEILPNTNPGLQVANGRTLALVGGGLQLDGGNLLAPDGRIELGSVRGGGLVNLAETATGWTLGYGGINSLGDISLINKASADTSGNGGSIQVQARSLSVLGGSTLLALTEDRTPGQGINIRATDFIAVSSAGVTADDVFLGTSYLSAIATDTGSFSTARGGDLTISTNSLRVTDGGQLSANSTGSGRGGDFTVNAQTVEVAGIIPGLTSSALSTVVNFGTGPGGNLTVNATNVRVLNGGQLSASTFDVGNAGQLTINAQSVLVDGTSDLGTSDIVSITSFGPGNSGRIEINTDRLQVSNGGRIATSTFTEGAGGALVINARDLQVTGVGSAGGPSRIVSNTEATATGPGGELTINSDRLQISEGGRISADTFGAANGGNLSVVANILELSGTTPDGLASQLSALTFTDSTGNAGNLNITTNQLQILSGAQIVAATTGTGNSGTLTVNAVGIDLAGAGPLGRSGLFGNALVSTGAGGDVQVTANRLTLRDGATINVGNFPSNNPDILPGQGSVGNTILNASQILLDNASITADSAGGTGGNLFLQSETLVLRRGSTISTNALGAATGGNITINTDFLVAVQNENSDITANAVNNFGGRVIVTARSILGLEYRLQLTPFSDITATSALGPLFNGTVEIRTPDIDPSQGLTQLPSGLVDPSRQVAARCERAQGSQFVISGRGGLPADASQTLRGGSVWQDLRLSATPQTRRAQVFPARQFTTSPDRLPAPFVEAQAWGIDSQGRIVAIATPTSRTADARSLALSHCAQDYSHR